METLRLFVNRYIAEDNEGFTKSEFNAAVFVTILVCAGFIWACCVDL